MTLRVQPDGIREHVVLQLYEDDKPLGYILFDGASAEKHIQDVGDARAELNDPVAPELDPGSRLKAIVNPNWKVEDHRVSEGRVISFRHPGLGWLTFILSDDSVREMVKRLTR
jgi:hypothetical protein